MEPPSYPVTFSVDYPDRKLNRLTTFFRAFTIIPIVIVISLFAGGAILEHRATRSLATPPAPGLGLLTLPTILMVLFRKKYPRWWFDWNLEMLRFGARIGIYASLMDDRYPSTDEQQSAWISISRIPHVEGELDRWHAAWSSG